MASTDDPQPEPKALTPDQIVEKLNRIPTFCIASASGDLFCAKDGKEGKEPFVLWHTDAELAKKVLEQARSAMPGATLKCLPLGLVMAVSLGWADMGSPYPFRISATDAALATFEKLSPGTPAKLLEQDGGWALPIFFSEHIRRADGFPIFLDPAHAAKAWAEIQAGREPGALPQEPSLEAVDLREFIKRLREGKDGRDWSDALFIGSKAALELAAAERPQKSSEASSTPEELERKKEICSLLNQIPVFTLVDPGGSVLACPDEKGKPFIPWVLDGSRAKEMRDSALRQGRAGTSLVTQPLGDIAAILLGWKSQTSTAAMRVTSYPEAYALLMKSVEGSPKGKELASRDWLVPAFACAELDTPSARTVFLSHHDLLSLLKKKREAATSGSDESEAPTDADENGKSIQLAVYELCDIMVKMLKGDPEWASVRFIGPSNAREALELIRELKEDSQIEPPPLESADVSNEAPPTLSAQEEAEMAVEPSEPDAQAPDVADRASDMFRTKEAPKSAIPRVLVTLAILAALIALVMGWLSSAEGAVPAVTINDEPFDETSTPSMPTDS